MKCENYYHESLNVLKKHLLDKQNVFSHLYCHEEQLKDLRPTVPYLSKIISLSNYFFLYFSFNVITCNAFLWSNTENTLSINKWRMFFVKSRPAWKISRNSDLDMGPNICTHLRWIIAKANEKIKQTPCRLQTEDSVN